MSKTHQIVNSYNLTKYLPGQIKGHYESFFLRANSPDAKDAFWIRYTIFSPDKHPEKAIGELWAVYFDARNFNHIAVKKEVSFTKCHFSNSEFKVNIDGATLDHGKLTGSIINDKNNIEWDMEFSGSESPLFDFPEKLYNKKLPKAKVLVGLPFAVFNGFLKVNGRNYLIKDWIGSENHNWGQKHTDEYAWGQAAGFDNAPDTFLELATARIKFGPVKTPFITPIVLRHKGTEYRFNKPFFTTGKAKYSYFEWNFKAKSKEIIIEGNIKAEKKHFVCLPYYNPPGGIKYCLNSKIAGCILKIYADKRSVPEILTATSNVAFEILTDDSSHGLGFDILPASTFNQDTNQG